MIIPKPRYAVIDTETTGLTPENNEIIQFAGILLSANLAKMHIVNLYAHPSKVTAEMQGAFAINGYAPEKWDALGATDQRGLIIGIRNFFNGAYRVIPVGHNIKFDIDFLRATFDRVNATKEFANYLSYHTLDTVSLSLFYDLLHHNIHARTYKLSALCERYSIKVEAAHNAQSDVYACLELLHIFLDAMQKNEKLPAPVEESSGLLEKDVSTGVWKVARGRFVGQSLEEVYKKDPGYISWMLRGIPELSEEQRAVIVGIRNVNKPTIVVEKKV